MLRKLLAPRPRTLDSHPVRRCRPALACESLESRQLLSLTPMQPAATAPPTPVAAAMATLPSGIPILNSLPGAAASIYLDFDGFSISRYGSYLNVVQPPFDTDGNSAAFSAPEVDAITQIWQAVAEDYAPFAVNVTTVEASSYTTGTGLRVSIGGNGAWTRATLGGASYVNVYSNSNPNVVFVFPRNLANNPRYIADCASHEAGHGFGLQHQSTYDTAGRRVQEYSTGPGDGTAPLMGVSYSAPRSLWWQGTTTSAGTIQDDMAVIASATNRFGYRADDIGDTALTATPLVPAGTTLQAQGILGRPTDRDAFTFTTTTAGAVALSVATVAPFNNLSPALELWNAAGDTLIAAASPNAAFTAAISATLDAGTYTLVVATSDGRYGNTGQYRIDGSLPEAPPAPSLPESQTARPPILLGASPDAVDQALASLGEITRRSRNARPGARMRA